MKSETSAPSGRIIALDYLRGFFITVIIIDHLWRWPNIFQLITGRGELWVSAAEGFVLISGLLLGYVHGYKKRHIPLASITKKLIKRGVMLYVWMWITALLLVAVTWKLAPQGGMAYIPIVEGDWSTLIHQMLSLNYAHSLTHFLYLYALYLIASPLVIWFLRRKLWWLVLVISFTLYALGMVANIESLQWQLIFFIATIIGYHFDKLTNLFYRVKPLTKRALRVGVILGMLTTFLISLFIVLPYTPGTYTDPIFTRRPLSWPTIPLAILWFFGLFSLFTYLLPFIERWGRWLLTFGRSSLTAYILHIIPVSVIQLLFSPTDGRFWFNTILAIICVASTWALMKIPKINRLIPR